MANSFTISNGANPNYLGTICKLGNIIPIEDSDHLCKTVVDGYTIVVSNNMKENDIVIYFPVETALCENFLSKNNLYELGEAYRNSNFNEVNNLILKSEDEKYSVEERSSFISDAKSKVGFFSKQGRVRIVKLRGVPSEGFIIPVDSLVKYDNSLKNNDWESMVGTTFDTIGNEHFCWKYVPPLRNNINMNSGNSKGSFWKKRMKKVKRFNRLVEGQFKFHYDTVNVNSVFNELSPYDTVTLTVKVHGTSAIFSKILCNRKLSTWEKIKKFMGFEVNAYEYGNVYSSRSVIKNQYESSSNNFYGTDIWGCVNKVISPYLEDGMTVYGEIVGYIEGNDKMIQKNHDYGCKIGQWKFMPYRITMTDKYGNDTEWNVMKVYEWTENLCIEHPEIKDKIMNLTVLYHGDFKDLYSDIEVDDKWHENVLERMKNDKDNFLMEEKEPLCKLYEKESMIAKEAYEYALKNNATKKELKKLLETYNKFEAMRAPREGIVIRIDNDLKQRAWKLKTNAHRFMECAQHDSGEVDVEEEA